MDGNVIKLNRINYEFKGKNYIVLIDELMEIRKLNQEYHNNESYYANSEAALSWILRGSIEYFEKIDEKFLGDGNDSGIPDIEADRFANNFYRLRNAMNELSEIWKLDYKDCEEIKFINDIRTLIVHSGEKNNKLISPKFNDYKDMQLGRIYSKKSERYQVQFIKSGYDYQIEVWADKRIKPKKSRKNEQDDKKYCDIKILLNANDIKKCILHQVEQFIHLSLDKIKIKQNPETIPDIAKIKVVEELDFKWLKDVSKNKMKSDYYERNGIEYWDGFGLEKLYQYSKNSFGIDDKTRKAVKEIIKERLDIYVQKFNEMKVYDNKNCSKYLEIEELPSLNIIDVFSGYTPDIKNKHYFEEKLFYNVAPTFNSSSSNECCQVAMLGELIYDVNEALGVELNLENSVDNVICDYFIKSVAVSIEKKGMQ